MPMPTQNRMLGGSLKTVHDHKPAQIGVKQTSTVDRITVVS